jgi:hypothetical protein
MSRFRQRADRIRKRVPIVEVLSAYGYEVRTDLEDREQQFRCDLHGDTFDAKPSARVYPVSNSWYCFACSASRDAIATVQAKEDLSFSEACRKLEEGYGLPKMDWGTYKEPKRISPSEVLEVTQTVFSFPEEQQQCKRLLMVLTKSRKLPLKTIMILWEVFDMVGWRTHKKKISEEVGKQRLQQLKSKAIQLVSEEQEDS